MKSLVILLALILPAAALAQQPAQPQQPQSTMQAVIQTLQQQRNRALSEAQDAAVTVASLQTQIALERDWWARWWAGVYPAKK